MSSSLPPPPTANGAGEKKPLWKRRWFLISVGAFVGLGVIGSLLPQDESSEEGENSSESSETSTAQTAPEQTDPMPTSSSPSTIASTTTQAPETTVASVAAPVSTVATTQAASETLMPVIPCGTDLQLAQDLVQAAGVFLSLSEDATGQGRMQVMDRNWTVLYATPDPGTPIGEGDAVFYVVKDEEFQGC